MTTSSMQPWLIGQLIDQGILTQSRLGRKAKARECRHCRSWILTGLDADLAAIEVQADPHPLSPDGEVAALLDDRHTYDLEEHRLYRRYHWNIAGRPAGERHRVLADHRCGAPIPASWQQPPRLPSSRQEEPF